MRRIRPKPFVHIKFKPHDKKRARWYWAIKLSPGTYQRVTVDGDSCIKEKVLQDGTVVCTQELLIGIPEEERKAVMNLHYAELEEE